MSEENTVPEETGELVVGIMNDNDIDELINFLAKAKSDGATHYDISGETDAEDFEITIKTFYNRPETPLEAIKRTEAEKRFQEWQKTYSFGIIKGTKP